MGYKDLSQQVFGSLHPLEIDWERTKQKKKTYWKCQCECGRIKSIRVDGLTSGRSTTCGECYNDYTGKKFGKLTALYKTKVDKNGHQFWMFKCDCGNFKETGIDNVKRGLVNSCGCYHSEVCSENFGINLTNQRFGKLVALKLVEISPRKYLCRCDCGGEIVVSSSNLTSHHTLSCGCLTSYGESRINNWLLKNNISFKKEYSIHCLEGFLGRPRFDFAIFKNNKVVMFIEYHGKQHYEDTFYGKCEERQEKDLIKRKWAKEQGIKLYEIPYWELNNIEDILGNIIKETASAPDLEEAEDLK